MTMVERALKMGLDIGALAVKVSWQRDGRTGSLYREHRGEPEAAIASIIRETGAPSSCAVTGSGGKLFAKRLGLPYVDGAVALMAAANPTSGVRHIIDIGGASLSIVDLDDNGRFAGFRTNSLCAAGTGSFLDEQAARMKLSREEMAAERNDDDPPRIAARCAVFAKSDLIHRQQEGFSIEEMWSGLCRGMVLTALGTLFRGRKPAGKVLIAGGVAKNREVLRWLRREIGVDLIVPDEPETFSATGAIEAARCVAPELDWHLAEGATNETSIPRRKRLALERSDYPSFECLESFIDDGTEVRLHRPLTGDVVLGIDIGSTSTKAVAINREGEVLADFYRRTFGNPIEATQKLFRTIAGAACAPLTVLGAGTTGSGRKMIGMIVRADCIVNEITAHVKGAAAEAPDVETIFEIGGQDAKFVSIREGVPHDSNMNYVCAAGTGSFVEEQANKLGFALTEIGDAVMGTEPPFSSDRCTVFMEQDVHALIRAGFSRREVMGSVLSSVVQNYINRVVGRRPYSKKKICFMGATARNRGLVAAFEQLVDAPIVVSPYCHVMGAFGVARIVLDDVVARGTRTAFQGLGFAHATVELAHEECRLCSNTCRITRAIVGGMADGPSWGYLCGRDPDEKRVRVNDRFEPFRKRARVWKQTGHSAVPARNERTIGIPQTLLFQSSLPLWKRFFAELGIGVALSKPTDEHTLEIAAEWIGSDYCYPVKLAHGHLRELALREDVDAIFAPYIVQGEPHDDAFARSVFCPYNIGLPSIASAAGIAEAEGKPLIKPIVNFQRKRNLLVAELHTALAPLFPVGKREIARAWETALAAQATFADQVEAIGQEELAKLRANGGKGIVILGRPYNVYDHGANLGLPQKIADLGLSVLSVDMLPLKDVKVDPLFHNMYWRYGRRLLQAAHFVAQRPELNAVFLTNFGCGPDSFLQTYVEHIMKGKPMLLLEIDEHSADAGYITRLEAFRDVIAGKTGIRNSEFRTRISDPAIEVRMPNPESQVPETVWIPPMHPYGAPMMAAALRSAGRHAQPLPGETAESFAMAKRLCRGTECVPAPATIGAFLQVLSTSDAPERQRLFMPSAKGPCRFGQYHTLHRLMLDQAGYRDTKIEAWDDESGTYGTDRKLSRKLYNALLSADLLYKARCRIRPYAAERGDFDRLMEDELGQLVVAVERDLPIGEALAACAGRLMRVQRSEAKKPLVGIVGEIYVRMNPFTNGNLIETIEDAGGEAWLAPITEWVHYLSHMDAFVASDDRMGLGVRLKMQVKNTYMMRMQKTLVRSMRSAIDDRLEPSMASTIAAAKPYIPMRFEGESILTVGRAIEFARGGASLIINCAPFGCMPGTLTAGIFQKVEREEKVPIMSLFFDGETDLRHLVRTYLANLGARPPVAREGTEGRKEMFP
jgi:predicted CoA-substrate-specific enzyme activase